MKAVILAGGRGERLRPITDTRPKPLVPVLARPVMDYCLSLLAHHGVEEAYVTTHYLSDQIRHRYGQSAFGMTLSYSQEDTPLGTAGGVKLLEEHFLSEECFLVMSGDALCDFDLTHAIDFHKEKKADVTIVLSSVKTPLEYGVVLADTFEKIFAFSEKPDWSETFSDLVNTGVYILSPRVLEQIPKGKTFDFSHDLFPLLLKEQYSLYGYKDEGYWCDIGKIPSLYRCNMDVLQGKVKTYFPNAGKRVLDSDGKGGYFISEDAHVSEDALIQSGTVISPGARIESGSRVSGSLILERVNLEKGAFARDAVLCENTTLRENAMALPGSVVGAGSILMPDAETQRGKHYPPLSVLRSMPPFQEDSFLFTEHGAGVEEHVGLDGNEAQRLGQSFAGTFSQNIGIMWDEKREESASFAALFAGGVVKGGKKALLWGEGTSEMTAFAAALHRVPAVFVSQDQNRGLFFAFEPDGFPVLRKDTLRLNRVLDQETHSETGALVSVSGVREKYLDALCREMGSSDGMPLGLGGAEAHLLKQAAIKSGFQAYDRTRENGLSMEVFDRGLKLFADAEKIADTEKIRLYLIEKELESGKREFYLPDTLPQLFAEHIADRGGTAKFFSLSHTCRKEQKERAHAQKERWLYDNLFLAARLLSHLKAKSTELCRKEFRATPEIFISQLRYYPNKEVKSKLLGIAANQFPAQHGVRIRPGFYSIRIISEAVNAEAALESAFEYRGKLNEIEQNIRGK